jgi:hypothetical protein
MVPFSSRKRVFFLVRRLYKDLPTAEKNKQKGFFHG